MSLFTYGKSTSSTLGGGSSYSSKYEALTLPEKTNINNTNKFNVLPTSKENQNSGNNHKIVHNDFAPKRFGLKYDPPTIILEYLVPSSGKLYHHKMKLVKLTYDSNTQEMLDYIKKRHSQYFQSSKISDEQITEKLKKKLSGSSHANNNTTTKGPSPLTLPSYGGSTSYNATTSSYSGNANTFNSKPKDSLDSLFDTKTKKDENTTNNFGKSKLQPLSSNIGISSGPSKLTSLGSNLTNNKPKDNDPLGIFSKTSTNFWEMKDNKNTKIGGGGSGNGNDFWGSDLEDENDDEEIDYNHTNLNKLAPEEVQKHKEKMSVLFNKNQKKPGDPDFIYDKQEDFDPHEDNEWDDDF